METSEIREIIHAEKRDNLRYDTDCADCAQFDSSCNREQHGITRSGISFVSPKVGYLPVTALVNRYLRCNFYYFKKAEKVPSI